MTLPAGADAGHRAEREDRLLAGWDVGAAAVAGLLAGIAFWRGAAPGVLAGDSGELQFAAWLAGLPHPTGYPLYMLLGWAWSHGLAALGMASPAGALNLLSAAFGALAVALTALFCLALAEATVAPGRLLLRIAAVIGALAFAFTPTFWSQALVAEVYTLHAALTACLLWLALLWRKDHIRRPDRISPLLWALALLFGLSLAHHRTTLLLAPVLGIFLWRVAGTRYWRRQRRAALGAVGLAALPLLLYLYVPLRAGHSPYLSLDWLPGQRLDLLERSPAGLLSYLLGAGFAGEIQGAAHALAQASALPGRLLAELGPVGVALAAAGALILAARRCWSLLWLTGMSFAAFAAFNLVYAIGDIAVFYVPLYLLAWGWAALTLAWLAAAATRLARRAGLSPRQAQWPATALLLLCAGLPTFLFLSQAASQDRSQDSAAADQWAALLAADLPASAVLMSNDRDEMMPLWYAQQVNGVRPDLAGVFPRLRADPAWANVGRVVDGALATGRPVYLIKPMPGLEVKAALGEADAAGLTPVLGPAAAGQPALRVDAAIGDSVRLLGVTPDPLTPEAGAPFQVDLYWQADGAISADYTSFVQVLTGNGEKLAQSDHLVGGLYYPTSLWLPGETLLDRHTLAIPAGSAPGPYRLLIGLYRLTDSGVASVGQTTVELPAVSGLDTAG